MHVIIQYYECIVAANKYSPAGMIMNQGNK